MALGVTRLARLGYIVNDLAPVGKELLVNLLGNIHLPDITFA